MQVTAPQVPVEVEDYIADLAPDKRAVLYPVFDTIRDAMPEGYALGMNWGMIGWTVPLSTFPDTHNNQPLAYVNLAAQRTYHSLQLMALFSDPEADASFRAEWAAAGQTVTPGKSCLRFKSLADLDLDIVARTVASVSVEKFITIYQRARQRR